MPTYYWKALHLPSDQYLINRFSGSTLHTNRVGSKWQYVHELEQVLRNPINQFVKGPQTIKFDIDDWELQEFIVSLHKKVRIKIRPAWKKYVKKKIKGLKEKNRSFIR